LRFLVLYLASVFLLLAIVGYLFFENNRASMQSAMKFEMMYQGKMISSKIIRKAMLRTEKMNISQRGIFLKNINNGRFKAGFYDANEKPILTKIDNIVNFQEPFFVQDMQCYSVTMDPSNHMDIRYVVLEENELSAAFQELRLRIISYLVLSFILMAAVGYILSKLFLRPVRDQIEALDRFITDTTHELNTPISAILMTIQSLKGIEEKKMARLEASAKRLNIMYSSLTYRLEEKEELDKKVYIDKILIDRVEYMKELIELKHLTVKIDVEPFHTIMSQHSANRLIDNLLSNAIKYSNMKDSIIITLQGNILKIKDTGIGISPEAQVDIFKRYQRANKERGGFGIGLSIVFSICEKYNIKVELDSQKNKGSTFMLRFPKEKRGNDEAKKVFNI